MRLIEALSMTSRREAPLRAPPPPWRRHSFGPPLVSPPAAGHTKGMTLMPYAGTPAVDQRSESACCALDSWPCGTSATDRAFGASLMTPSSLSLRLLACRESLRPTAECRGEAGGSVRLRVHAGRIVLGYPSATLRREEQAK